MHTTNDYIMVLTTLPNQTVAEQLARQLLEKKLAACINIIPQLSSIYAWQGQIVKDTECLLFIKTSQNHYPELEQSIQLQHPYAVPELIALPITHGAKNYLNWLSSVLQ